MNLAVQFVLALVVIVFAIIGYFIWDRRYRGRGTGGSLKPTGEIFRDPSTGKMTRVYEDPATGRREYRDEA